MDGGEGDDQEGGSCALWVWRIYQKMWVGWGTETQIKSQNLAEQKKSLFDYQIYGVGGWTFSQITTCFFKPSLVV